MVQNTTVAGAARRLPANSIANEMYITLRAKVQDVALKLGRNRNWTQERTCAVMQIAIDEIKKAVDTAIVKGSYQTYTLDGYISCLLIYHDCIREYTFMTTDEYWEEPHECNINRYIEDICNYANWVYVEIDLP